MTTKFFVKKGILSGQIEVPPSKSHTLRAIVFAMLAKGKSVIHNYLPSPDTYAMIEACHLFGAKVKVLPDRLEIEGLDGKITQTEDVIHAGNSGIVLRFCAAIGALAQNPIVITGDHSIKYQRLMTPLLLGLSQLGVLVATMRGDGYAPVIIQGPLMPGRTVIEGQDSQHVSALLIAGAFAQGPVEIQVQNPGEKPWVALTLNWFDRLNIGYKNRSFENYYLPGQTSYDGFEYTVPGDFSSAAFPIAAALITQSEIVVKNIDMDDPQGDKELISVFQAMGAQIDIDKDNRTLYVKKGGELKGATVDINNFIDAITILAVVACFAEGETRILNASVARQKECNRIQAIRTELKKMGADIEETQDGLIIKKSKLLGADLAGYQDHRMIMSLTVAGLGAEGETTVSPVESVSKTYPTFIRDFNALGANIRTE